MISVDQSTRGIRHGNFRPELIIADDIEDIQSVTREGRDKLFEWFTKEIIPLGDMKTTRIFLVGNMLHRDSLLMKMKDRIESGEKSGIFRKYPLLDENGICLWKERYSEEDIGTMKETVGSETAWRTEYMLEDAGAEGQVVLPEWICYYDDFPPIPFERYVHDWEKRPPRPMQLVTGVDLAISEKESADETAFVSGMVWGKNRDKRLYITDAFAKRMDFSDTATMLEWHHRKQSDAYGAKFGITKHEVIVETVGYQEAMEQYLKKNSSMLITGKKPMGTKRDRLLLTTEFIRSGRILFPNTEAGRMLLEQLIGFGKERHDDLVDAFTIMVLEIFARKERIAVAWSI